MVATYMQETQIQNKILAALKKAGIFCWRCNNGAVWDSKLHTYRASVTLKGVPDIIGILPGGIFLGIEVKTDKGRQSPDQLLFQKRLEEEGGIYILARSVDDVKIVINR